MKSIAISTLAAILALAGISCESGKPAQSGPPMSCDRPGRAGATSAPASAVAKFELPTSGVRTITLPTADVQMPAGRGQPTFLSACMLCHTPRYVLIQPPFPRKTWVAEVEKMKKVYGAPITDEQIEPIVNYLVAIRGNGK